MLLYLQAVFIQKGSSILSSRLEQMWQFSFKLPGSDNCLTHSLHYKPDLTEIAAWHKTK